MDMRLTAGEPASGDTDGGQKGEKARPRERNGVNNARRRKEAETRREGERKKEPGDKKNNFRRLLSPIRIERTQSNGGQVANTCLRRGINDAKAEQTLGQEDKSTFARSVQRRTESTEPRSASVAALNPRQGVLAKSEQRRPESNAGPYCVA